MQPSLATMSCHRLRSMVSSVLSQGSFAYPSPFLAVLRTCQTSLMVADENFGSTNPPLGNGDRAVLVCRTSEAGLLLQSGIFARERSASNPHFIPPNTFSYYRTSKPLVRKLQVSKSPRKGPNVQPIRHAKRLLGHVKLNLTSWLS